MESADIDTFFKISIFMVSADMIKSTNNLLNDLRSIIERGRKTAYAAVNKSAILTYWHMGRRIVEEEQGGYTRAQYGKQVTVELGRVLSSEFGPAFSQRNLEYYRKFYLCFSDLEILNARVQNLAWTHFRRLLTVSNPQARLWYAEQASKERWSSRTLDRNICTQYFERRLAAQRQHLALPEPHLHSERDPMEYIKSPMVAEFLGFSRDTKYSESQLEQALIDNLEKFILELGRGFAFVARQQHISTDTEDFYIDLVFYNYRMKRFVIFELKTHTLNHEAVGQLDMYVRMYDDLVKGEDDLPTIGVLLCADTNDVIAKYSVLNGSEQLFASKYMAYMPTEEELRHEIERQKQFFLSQHGHE